VAVEMENLWMEVNGNIDDFLQGFAARPEKKWCRFFSRSALV
jgi:hypothetical protein